jgi:hypothetical protein
MLNFSKTGNVYTAYSEARSCNHCSSENAINITHSEGVFVALSIRHAKCMRRIVTCGLPRYTISFPHYFTNGTIFEKKMLLNIKCIFWVCVRSLKYPACKVHASYCHLWPAQIYYIFFPHYLINGTIFEKKRLLNIKCIFWFSLNFV